MSPLEAELVVALPWLFDLCMLLVSLRFVQFVLDRGVQAGLCDPQWLCSEPGSASSP